MNWIGHLLAQTTEEHFEWGPITGRVNRALSARLKDIIDRSPSLFDRLGLA